jgi:hypothetical protein
VQNVADPDVFETFASGICPFGAAGIVCVDSFVFGAPPVEEPCPCPSDGTVVQVGGFSAALACPPITPARVNASIPAVANPVNRFALVESIPISISIESPLLVVLTSPDVCDESESGPRHPSHRTGYDTLEETMFRTDEDFPRIWRWAT